MQRLLLLLTAALVIQARGSSGTSNSGTTKAPTASPTASPTTTWTVPSTCTMAKTAPQGGGTVDCKSGFNTTTAFFSAGHPSGTKTGRLTLTYSASMTCTVRNAALEPNARVRSPSHTRGRHTRDGSLQLV